MELPGINNRAKLRGLAIRGGDGAASHRILLAVTLPGYLTCPYGPAAGMPAQLGELAVMGVRIGHPCRGSNHKEGALLGRFERALRENPRVGAICLVYDPLAHASRDGDAGLK